MEFLTPIFSTFYNFFMTIVTIMQFPFQDFIQGAGSGSFTNIFYGYDIPVGVNLSDVPIISDIINIIQNLTRPFLDAILHVFHLTYDSPTWMCLLTLLGFFIGFLILAKFLVAIFKNVADVLP